jgi:hypothetical protein
MSRLHSRPLASAAPLPRQWLDSIATPARIFFGSLFITWSWASTIIIVGWFLEPLMGNRSAVELIADRYAAGLLLAFLVTVAEFVSAERWPGAYWTVLLTLDASFTTVQTHGWLHTLVSARVEVSAGGDAALWAVSLIGGVVAAVFGELLLFGRRRH